MHFRSDEHKQWAALTSPEGQKLTTNINASIGNKAEQDSIQWCLFVIDKGKQGTRQDYIFASGSKGKTKQHSAKNHSTKKRSLIRFIENGKSCRALFKNKVSRATRPIADDDIIGGKTDPHA